MKKNKVKKLTPDEQINQNEWETICFCLALAYQLASINAYLINH